MRVSRRQQLFDAYEADEHATVVALADLVLESNADDGPVLIRLGALQSALAQYEIAQPLPERALLVVPETKRHIVLSHLGALCKHRGDLIAAARYYEAASRILPDDATYHIYRGAIPAANRR